MTTEISSSTNLRINPEEHYGQKVLGWLIEEEENIIDENMAGKNNENVNYKTTNNEINNSIFKDDLKEGLFQESFLEEDLYKENSSQEESTQEESTQEETFRSSSGSSSSSLYTAELITPHRSSGSSSSNGSSENEISSPIKPLKAITTPTTSSRNSNSNSNVYEILQEIKPEHPLQIHTRFDFATNTNSRPSSISQISLNPLLHHHRNSTYNSSPTSVNYIPPRRYSDFRTSSFHNNNNYGAPLKSPMVENPLHAGGTDNNLTIKQLHTNIIQEKNINLPHEERIMYGKYLFWAGFLLIPVWWVGSFYKPTSTEDYKWRKRCRKASTWSFVTLIVIFTLIVVINQRLKVGL